MATDNATINVSQVDNVFITWGPMANGDVGNSQGYTGSADRTFQVTGTFGSGGTVVLEGSLDGANWFPLHDPLGAAISKTSAGLSAVLEHCPFIRPHVTAGDGTTAITAILAVRRNFNG